MSFHDDITETEGDDPGPPDHSLASIVGLTDVHRLAVLEELWALTTSNGHWIPLYVAAQLLETTVRSRMGA